MKFTQWILIRESKKPIPTSPVKNDDMLITGKVGKIATGHKAHMSGAGVHDSRPKKQKTRQGQEKFWKAEQGFG